MGNVLKSEFYKLTHSKKYYVFYGIALVLWLATFISRMIAKTDSGWLVGLTDGGTFGWDMFVAVFAVIYILDDFKNGYLKNIYFSANKFCYVFAKFLCVLLLLLALKEVINAIIGLIGGTSMSEDFFNKICPYGMKIELLAPLANWWHYLLFLACWIVLSFLGSVLIYSKRRVKV